MNPYDRIFQAMHSAGREEATCGKLMLRHGNVLSTSPLKIEVAGTDQEAERFWISHRLLKGHSEQCDVKGTLSVTASCSYGSHSSMGVNSGQLTLTTSAPVLQQGDDVLLLTADDQEFYLLDKVVRA